MKQAFVVLICLHALLCIANAEHHDKHEDHNPIHKEHYHDGEHDEDYDHEAVLGSEEEEAEFAHLEPKEAKKRLGQLVDRMDDDADGSVSKAELTKWIMHSFKTLDAEEALKKLHEHDENENDKLEWSEYLDKTYGHTDAEIKKFAKDNNKDQKEIVEMYNADLKKWKLADQDKDGSLNKDEYAAFLHPGNYAHTIKFEIDETLESHDKNKDGAIDLKEYLGNEKLDPQAEQVETTQFNGHDKNKDGKLDMEEIKQWMAPDHKTDAEEETNHLFAETDKDKDDKLSKEEIVDQHKLWVGSDATNYGQHLQDEL